MPFARGILRLSPYALAALTAYDLYRWLQPGAPTTGHWDYAAGGWTVDCERQPAVCGDGGGFPVRWMTTGSTATKNPYKCFITASSGFAATDVLPAHKSNCGSTARYFYDYAALGVSCGNNRGASHVHLTRKWFRPKCSNPDENKPEQEFPEVPWVPGATPWFPVDKPYPYPFAPELPPNLFPRSIPKAEPGTAPQPPADPVLATPGPGYQPSVDWSPGGRPLPGHHQKEPPDPPDKERKKRLTPGQSRAWLLALEKAGSSYMEYDDMIAALYQGIHWRYRRWRGRDGVWRDRDITSVSRAKRLMEMVDDPVKFNLVTGLKSLAYDQAVDFAFGKIGKAIGNNTRKAGEKGLWAGLQGPSAFGRAQKASWEEAEKLLKKQQAERILKRPPNTYTTREYDHSTRQWVTRTRVRPVSQIPWFKQESFYKRFPARGTAKFWELSGPEKAARKGNVVAHYYAPSRSRRDLTLVR